MKKVCGALCLMLMMVVIGCSSDDDDYVYPNVLTNFVDITTDSNGYLHSLVDDSNDDYSISNTYGGVKKDSVYRVVAQYRLLDDSSVYLYNTTKTISPVPVPSDHIKGGFVSDSVRMQSIWMAGDYINSVIQVESNNGSQAFHFGQDSLSTHNNHKVLALRLYHKQGNDAEYYTRKVYLSVPLKKYGFVKDDTIKIGFNLYGEGMTYYKFVKN